MFKLGTYELWKVAKIECVFFLILYTVLILSFCFYTNTATSITSLLKLILVLIFIGMEIIIVRGKGESKQMVFATLMWFNLFATSWLTLELLHNLYQAVILIQFFNS
jgi:hypothetical protein